MGHIAILIRIQVAEFGIKTSFQGQDFYDGELGQVAWDDCLHPYPRAVSMVEGKPTQRA